jgi:outer membrane protein assembly factor BamE (lipoprotein component of BamABCDE complex)
MIKRSNNLFLLTACALALSSAACAPTIDQRGNMLSDFQLSEIKAGESTRSEVLRALGSPTTQSTFDPSIWYYIGQETEKRGILDPKITKERIILVAFNPEGVLESIEEIDRSRMNIPYVREKTPTHGNDVTFMQQFLGNLGKFNPATDEK